MEIFEFQLVQTQNPEWYQSRLTNKLLTEYQPGRMERGVPAPTCPMTDVESI